MNESMTPELAEQFIARRIRRPRETWKRSTEWLAPHLNSDSVKAYVSNYKSIKASDNPGNGRVNEKEQARLCERYKNIIYNKFLSYNKDYELHQSFRLIG